MWPVRAWRSLSLLGELFDFDVFVSDQASEEKKRLEEKQRAARKNRSKSEEDWQTRCVAPPPPAWQSCHVGQAGRAQGGLRGMASLKPCQVAPRPKRVVISTD